MKRRFRTVLVAMLLVAAAGCAQERQKDRDFFTSGNREADQRADQRMAQAEQLQGGEEGQTSEGKGDGQPAQANEKQPLYQRLGGETGITAIVDDFVTRALADPRVNWERKGVKRGGFSLNRGKSVEWSAAPDNVKRLKLHIAQFVALATGGPSRYQGKEMKQAHQGLHITNAEFDAAVGDLKATLDKLKIPNQEQKELLAIIESTRPQVVEER
jgi:hemoglobin